MKKKSDQPALDVAAVDYVLDPRARDARNEAPSQHSIRRVQETLAYLRAMPEPEHAGDVSDKVWAGIKQDEQVHARISYRPSAAIGALAASFAIGLFILWLHSGPPALDRNPAAAARLAGEHARAWLLDAQEKDGRWNPARWGGDARYEMALTALSLMALMEAPSMDARHEEAIHHAATYLARQLEENEPSRPNLALLTHALTRVRERFHDAPWRHELDTRAPNHAWTYAPQKTTTAPAQPLAITSTTPEPWARLGGQVYAMAVLSLPYSEF